MRTTSTVQEEKHWEGKAQNPKGENQTVRRWQPINAEDSFQGAVEAILSPPVVIAQPAKTHQGLFGVVTSLGFCLGPKPTYPSCTLAQGQFAKYGSPAFRASSAHSKRCPGVTQDRAECLHTVAASWGGRPSLDMKSKLNLIKKDPPVPYYLLTSQILALLPPPCSHQQGTVEGSRLLS